MANNVNNLLNFKFGIHDNLPEDKTAGTVYVTTDEQAMYIDLPNAANANTIDRIRIGDIIVKNSSRDLAPPFAEGAFYYFVSENALLRWNGSEWTQINSVADVTSQVKTAQDTADSALARANEAYTLANGKATLAEVKALDYATKAEAKGYADVVLGDSKDTSDKNTVYGAKAAAAAALNAANAAQAAADGKATLAEVKALDYATKAEAKGYADVVLGTSADTSSANTVYGAKAAAAAALEQANSANGLALEAKNIGEAAQGTADSALGRANDAYSLAEGKATLAEVKALNYATKTEAEKYAKDVLGTASDAATVNTVYGAKAAASAAQSAAKTAQDTVDALSANVLLLDGSKTMAGSLDMGSTEQKKHKIINLATPEYDADAATKKYVDDSIAANDAMTFIGSVGVGGDVTALPTTANKGDTYKVNSAGKYANIDAKVGDLFINKGADGQTASWSHISSGYEDDYLQKLVADSNTIYLTNGINDTSTDNTGSIKLVGSNSSNLQFSIASTGNQHTITGQMVWGTF